MSVHSEPDGWRWQTPGCEAFISARSGGVSPAPWESRNLGLHVGDEPARVLENRRRVAARLGRELEQVAGVNQVHGADVWFDIRTAAALPAGVRWDEAPTIDADALVTTRSEVALAVGIADCLPIALILGDAIAAIHAGWRSLEAGVIEATIAVLNRAAGLSAALDGTPRRALIGPGICGSCMEVGDEVAARFAPEVVTRRSGGLHPLLDLRADAARRLEAAGFGIDHVDVCTIEDDRLFSHRGDGGASTGRQALLVQRRM